MRERTVEMIISPVVKQIQETFLDLQLARFSRYAEVQCQICPGSWVIPKLVPGFMGFYR